MNKKKYTQLINASFILVLFFPFLINAAPRVVVSIKPVHSLVTNIMQGVTEPFLILDGYASPHTYRLKPSSAKAIQQADIVVYVSNHLETFLVKSLNSLASQAKIIRLESIKSLRLLEFREDLNWGKEHKHGEHEHDKEHDKEHEQEQKKESHQLDPHLWLDPNNAQVIVAHLVDILSKHDPKNAKTYQNNAKLLNKQLSQLDHELTKLLQAYTDKAYLVFHDSYQYLETHYHLKPVGSIIFQSEQMTSAYRLKKLQQLIKDNQVSCVFTEPQFSDKKVKVVTAGLDVKIGALDPLGSEIDKGKAHYVLMMRKLVSAFTHCLGEERS